MKTRIALLFILLLVLSGCGVKGKLVQAGKPLPAAPNGLTLQQKGNDLLLSWIAPTINQDGTPLADLKYFIISRLSYRPGDYCDECLDSGADQNIIYPDLPAPAFLKDNRFYLLDTDLPHNVGYRYRIVPVNNRNEAGVEGRTHRTMHPAPTAPTELQIKSLDRSLRINWETATTPEEQDKLLGINLYRAVGDMPFDPNPVNSQPIKDSQYLDFGLDNNKKYQYRLRSVIDIDGQQIESPFTAPIEATPSAEF